VVEYLTGLGHTRLARVTGIPRFWHTKIRTDAFLEAAQSAGSDAVCVEADYTGEHGASATRRLLRARRPPTAILYDNDIMAVSGLSAVQQMGFDVPADLSIVAWDDSPLCELVHPPLTALTRDVAAYGAHAAQTLIQVAGGAAAGNFEEAVPVLTPRGSTGRAPRAPSRPRASGVPA
jgi:DNA-binding LacI/PurR family transcriptional regulator